MLTFKREIYPVGHGGFIFETIGDYSIVFDCGSDTAPTRVSMYIDKLPHDKPINRIYISHFDKDHVNSIKELVRKVGIKEAVIPYVPIDFRVIYDSYTRGAFLSIRNFFSDENINIIEIQQEEKHNNNVWEWISHSLLTFKDWQKIKSSIIAQGLKIDLLSDVNYIDNNKETINNCFKKVFGSNGPNSKGLVLLSQCKNGIITSNKLKGNLLNNYQSAALFTGDADLRNKANKNDLMNFINNNLSRQEKNLTLFQIPHHGSETNRGASLDSDFPSLYYFYHDISSDRLKTHKPALYNRITTVNKLFDVRDIGKDCIIHKIEMQ